MNSKVTPEQWDKFYFAAKIVKACVDGAKKNKLQNCATSRNHFAAMFAQLIFNSPKLHSGLISKEGRLQKTSKKNATADHYRGRKGSGFVLYDQAMKGKSINRLAILIASRARVHLISAKENDLLRRVASSDPYKGKTQINKEYVDNNIILEVFVPIVHRKFDYHINGSIYTRMKEIKDTFGVSDHVVRHRCNSPKYSEWQKVQIV